MYILYLSLLNDYFFIDSDNRLSWVKLICFQGCHDHFSHFVGISCLFAGIFFEYTTLLSHTKANKLLRTLYDHNILTSKALHTGLCSLHPSCSAHWAFLSTLLLRQMLEKRKFRVPSGKAVDQSSALRSPRIWAGDLCVCYGDLLMHWPGQWEEWVKSWEVLLLAVPFIFYRIPGPVKVSFLTVSCLDDASSVSLPDELCRFGTCFRKHPGDFPRITTVFIQWPFLRLI